MWTRLGLARRLMVCIHCNELGLSRAFLAAGSKFHDWPSMGVLKWPGNKSICRSVPFAPNARPRGRLDGDRCNGCLWSGVRTPSVLNRRAIGRSYCKVANHQNAAVGEVVVVLRKVRSNEHVLERGLARSNSNSEC
jgi:hypothetical protein